MQRAELLAELERLAAEAAAARARLAEIQGRIQQIKERLAATSPTEPVALNMHSAG